MRTLLNLLFICTTLNTYSQAVPEMHPTLGYLVDTSEAGETAFIQKQEQCEKVWKKVNNRADYEKLSEAEKNIYDTCDESKLNYWDVLGAGCSWYCGGGQDTLSASSILKSHKELDYTAKNIHDLNYQTAWIEGVPGYGIGEYVMYHFPPENPRITEIIIVNGYVKSLTTWRNNSRVKKLKMYVDNQWVAILNLADSRQEQHFHFDPLGYGDRENYERLKAKPWWTIKFEILEVYKGDKYDDTAITEIYFDEIDVH